MVHSRPVRSDFMHGRYLRPNIGRRDVRSRDHEGILGGELWLLSVFKVTQKTPQATHVLGQCPFAPSFAVMIVPSVHLESTRLIKHDPKAYNHDVPWHQRGAHPARTAAGANGTNQETAHGLPGLRVNLVSGN